MQKNTETLNNMSTDKEIDEYIDGVVEHFNKYGHPAVRAKRIDFITPASLKERGFNYTAVRISGADMWQGMAIWYNAEKGITLRGNPSTAKGGTLRLQGYFDLALDNLQELDTLIKLFK